MKILKEYAFNELVSTQLQLDLMFNYPVKQLNDTEVKILAYIFVYGALAEEKLLEDKIMLTQNSLNNYFSSLRKRKLLTGERQYKPTKLIPELNPRIVLHKCDSDLEIKIKFI